VDVSPRCSRHRPTDWARRASRRPPQTQRLCEPKLTRGAKEKEADPGREPRHPELRRSTRWQESTKTVRGITIKRQFFNVPQPRTNGPNALTAPRSRPRRQYRPQLNTSSRQNESTASRPKRQGTFVPDLSEPAITAFGAPRGAQLRSTRPGTGQPPCGQRSSTATSAKCSPTAQLRCSRLAGDISKQQALRQVWLHPGGYPLRSRSPAPSGAAALPAAGAGQLKVKSRLKHDRPRRRG